jgi:hypothetical protein
MAYHTTIHRLWQFKVYIQQQKNKNFQHFTTWLTIHKQEKAKLRAALWKYLNAHFLYPVDEVWAMCKFHVLRCFVKCFIVIYNVKMCVCVFMTSSTSYSLRDTLMENLFIVAYTCLNVRIWALWCARPLIMGDTEDISSSLLSTIIFSNAVLELVAILVAKIYCVL